LPFLLADSNRCALHGNHAGCGHSGLFNTDRVRCTRCTIFQRGLFKNAIEKTSWGETQVGIKSVE
jgi:hypothetical protein